MQGRFCRKFSGFFDFFLFGCVSTFCFPASFRDFSELFGFFGFSTFRAKLSDFFFQLFRLFVLSGHFRKSVYIRPQPFATTAIELKPLNPNPAYFTPQKILASKNPKPQTDLNTNRPKVSYHSVLHATLLACWFSFFLAVRSALSRGYVDEGKG